MTEILKILTKPMEDWPFIVPDHWAPPSQDTLATTRLPRPLHDINDLAQTLQSLGYIPLTAHNANDLHTNLRHHISKLNNRQFTDPEWRAIFTTLIDPPNPLSNGDTTDQALTRYYSTDTHTVTLNNEPTTILLADRYKLERNTLEYLTHPTSQRLTIFLNGFPLTHITLHPTTTPLEQAVESLTPTDLPNDLWGSPLARYLTIRISTNTHDTAYYSATTYPNTTKNPRVTDTHDPSIPTHTLLTRWTDSHHNHITSLHDFTHTFLRPDALTRILTWYCLPTPYGSTLVMRPHQIATAERIIHHTLTQPNTPPPPAWHTPGSGRTTTIHLTATILNRLTHIDHTIIILNDEDATYPSQTLLLPHSHTPYHAVDGAQLLHQLITKGPAPNTNRAALAEQSYYDSQRSITVPLSIIQLMAGLRHTHNQIIKAALEHIHSQTCTRRTIILLDNCELPTHNNHPILTQHFPNSQYFAITSNPTHLNDAPQLIPPLTPTHSTKNHYTYVTMHSERTVEELRPAPSYPSALRKIGSFFSRGLVAFLSPSSHCPQAKIIFDISTHLRETQSHLPPSSSGHVHTPSPAILLVETIEDAYEYARKARYMPNCPLSNVVIVDKRHSDERPHGRTKYSDVLHGAALAEDYFDSYPDSCYYQQYLHHCFSAGHIDLLILVNRSIGTITTRPVHVFIDSRLTDEQLLNAVAYATSHPNGSVTTYRRQPALQRIQKIFDTTLTITSPPDPTDVGTPTEQEQLQAPPVQPQPIHYTDVIYKPTFFYVGSTPDQRFVELSLHEQDIVREGIKQYRSSGTHNLDDLDHYTTIYQVCFSFTRFMYGQPVQRLLQPSDSIPQHSNGTPIGARANDEYSNTPGKKFALYGKTSGHFERGKYNWYGVVIPLEDMIDATVGITLLYAKHTPEKLFLAPHFEHNIPITDLPLDGTLPAINPDWFIGGDAHTSS